MQCSQHCEWPWYRLVTGKKKLEAASSDGGQLPAFYKVASLSPVRGLRITCHAKLPKTCIGCCERTRNDSSEASRKAQSGSYRVPGKGGLGLSDSTICHASASVAMQPARLGNPDGASERDAAAPRQYSRTSSSPAFLSFFPFSPKVMNIDMVNPSSYCRQVYRPRYYPHHSHRPSLHMEEGRGKCTLCLSNSVLCRRSEGCGASSTCSTITAGTLEGARGHFCSLLLVNFLPIYTGVESRATSHRGENRTRVSAAIPSSSLQLTLRPQACYTTRSPR